MRQRATRDEWVALKTDGSGGLSTSYVQTERIYHRVPPPPGHRRLSIVFPATKVKRERELDGEPAGQEEVLYTGRSIKCPDAIQAKSNGNS